MFSSSDNLVNSKCDLLSPMNESDVFSLNKIVINLFRPLYINNSCVEWYGFYLLFNIYFGPVEEINSAVVQYLSIQLAVSKYSDPNIFCGRASIMIYLNKATARLE